MFYIVRNKLDGKRAASMQLSWMDEKTGKWKSGPIAIHVFITKKQAKKFSNHLNSFTVAKPWQVVQVDLREVDA